MKRFKPIIIFSLFVLIGTGCIIAINYFRTHSASESGNVSGRPNIVIINIDSLRADHMGVYGYEKQTTPFLDSLFSQGAVFEQAIAPTYLTFQTDAAILSGLYASQNNVTTWETPLKPDLKMLPDILKLYGYQTGAFVSSSLNEQFGFNKHFQTWEQDRNPKNIAQSRLRMASWMKRTSRPFFAFWHIYDVHIPYTHTQYLPSNVHYDGPFADYTNTWFYTQQSRTNIMRTNPKLPGPESYPITDTDIQYLRQAYDSGIRYTDEQLRLFFQSIKSQPWYRNTIFIISAEHGDDLKEHGFIMHGDIYENNIHVPLAIIAPGRLPPIRIKQPVSLLDILPTVTSLAGAVTPANAEGRNLKPAMAGQSVATPDVYTERQPFDEYAIRQGPWKYILRNQKIFDPATIKAKIYDTFFGSIAENQRHASDELFDLSSDPNEQHNVLGAGLPIESELKAKALEFQKRMDAAHAENAAIPSALPPGSIITYP